MLTVNQDKCTRCGICAQDCFCGVISHTKGELPVFHAERFAHCIHCQHCFAVCPQGAIVYNGMTAEESAPVGSMPDPDNVMNFIRQRRSIRRYKEDPIPEEQMRTLKESLRWMPTGCNNHRLFFAIVEDRASMDYFRDTTRRVVGRIARPWLIKLLPKAVAGFLKALVIDGEDVIYYHAPHMIVCASPKNSPCKEADPWIALSYFDVLAQSFGLGTCWCGFAVIAFRLSGAMRRKIQLPSGYKVTSVILFGKPDIRFARPTNPDPYKIVEVTTP